MQIGLVNLCEVQEYCVDSFAKVEFDRLRWIAKNQAQLRSDLYQGVADALDTDDTQTCRNIGKKILPSSFYGGPRSVAQKYQVITVVMERISDHLAP